MENTPNQNPATRDQVKIKRALVSVSDKTGLVELAKSLNSHGVEIVSTGSTAKAIADAGISVTEVSELTKFPESLDGRVKTLHPAVHAGILADLRLEQHRSELNQLGIAPFELVVVNLYPFVQTVKSGAVAHRVVEQIDIGGPAMVRAAAKNHDNVAIVVDPKDYEWIFSKLDSGTSLADRRILAQKAFAHTAAYDSAVANWFSDTYRENELFPDRLLVAATKISRLRYGENAHQQAALYVSEFNSGIADAELLSGKEMSYNNFIDADAALRAAYDFNKPAVAIIKHANPCGIAVSGKEADLISDAYLKAHATDPVSAFGGVIAANRPVTEKMARQVAEVFTEVIVAPGFEPKALEILSAKKNLRILQLKESFQPAKIEARQISGGFLLQQSDGFENLNTGSWKLVSGPAATKQQLEDLEFAWRAVRSVKSNAILLANEGAAVGIGMGQVNRLDSCRLAVARAGERTKGSVVASDAFFPFADGLQVLIVAGVSAVVQPGGSMRDEEVIQAAQAAGLTMYFTGERHFFH